MKKQQEQTVPSGASPVQETGPSQTARAPYEAPTIAYEGSLAAVVEAQGSPVDLDGLGFRDVP